MEQPVTKQCPHCLEHRPLHRFRHRTRRHSKLGLIVYTVKTCKYCETEKAKNYWRSVRKKVPCPHCGHLTVEK